MWKTELLSTRAKVYRIFLLCNFSKTEFAKHGTKSLKYIIWNRNIAPNTKLHYTLKCFRYRNTLYQLQTLLYKYTIYSMVHTNYRTIVCCTKYRIARTYLQHNTCPHTKYKQHTPYQIQNECIATIHQIQNHGKNNTHIILHTKYRKTHFTTPNTEHCSTIARTYAKYRTLNAARYRQNTAASKYVHISAGICTS